MPPKFTKLPPTERELELIRQQVNSHVTQITTSINDAFTVLCEDTGLGVRHFDDFEQLEKSLRPFSLSHCMIEKMKLHRSRSYTHHEYVTIKFQLYPRMVFYLRLDRMGDISSNLQWSGVVSSSKPASIKDQICITRNTTNLNYIRPSEIQICGIVFYDSQPSLLDVKRVFEHLRTHGRAGKYRLLWENCWAFSRAIIRIFTLRHKISKDALQAPADPSLKPTNPDEVLEKLKWKAANIPEIFGVELGIEAMYVGEKVLNPLWGVYVIAAILVVGLFTDFTPNAELTYKMVLAFTIGLIGLTLVLSINQVWRKAFRQNWIAICDDFERDDHDGKLDDSSTNDELLSSDDESPLSAEADEVLYRRVDRQPALPAQSN